MWLAVRRKYWNTPQYFSPTIELGIRAIKTLNTRSVFILTLSLAQSSDYNQCLQSLGIFISTFEARSQGKLLVSPDLVIGMSEGDNP